MFNMFRSSGAKTISPAEALEQQKGGGIHLVDVREAGEWAQMRVPGSIHAPLAGLAQAIRDLPTDKPVVFYCLSGQRSARAVDLARQLGLAHDTHVAGGISAWRAAGLPVER